MANIEITTVQTSDLLGMMRELIREEFAQQKANEPKPIILHTTTQVQEKANVSESTIRRDLKRGKLKSIRVRGRIMVKDEDLRTYLEFKS